MGSVRSSSYKLAGINSYYLELKWSEKVSNSTNTVAFEVWFHSKYRAQGSSWKCSLSIDDTNVKNEKIAVNGGGSNYGASVKVLSFDKSFSYTGSKKIKVTAKYDINYYDVTLGTGSTVYRVDNFTHTITLGSTNGAPGKPSISCTNASHDGNRYAEKTLDITLGSVTDPDGDKVNYEIYMRKKSPSGSWGSYTKIHGPSTSRTISYDVSSHTRGTQYNVYGIAVDSHGVQSAMSTILTNIYRNKKPSAITKVCPVSTEYYNENFSISWPKATDVDGQIIKYKVERSIDDGSFTVVQEATSTSYTQTGVENHAEGTSYQYRVSATDGLVYGTSYKSVKYYKNSRPTTPTQIFPRNGYYLGNVNIKWNASTDPDKKGIDHYDVYINNNKVGSSKKSPFTWTIPNNDAEGSPYKASVIALDKNGASSTKGTAEGIFYKAIAPTAPSWFKPEDKYHESVIQLSWEPIKSCGEGTTYVLQYRLNGGAWINLKTNLEDSEYNHEITSIERGSKIEYRVKTKNAFQQESDWKTSMLYCRNRLSLSPKIRYPKSGATIYDKSPRIALTIFADPDKQDQVICVEYGGAKFNSNSHPSMFSKGNDGYSVECNVVFFAKELSIGMNEIKVYLNDGLADGNATTVTYNVSNSNLSAKKDDIITANLFKGMNNCIGTLRKSYSLDSYTFKNHVLFGSVIKFEHIDEMRKAVFPIRQLVNNFDSDNITGDKEVKWFTPDDNGYIYSEYVQEIIDVINSV